MINYGHDLSCVDDLTPQMQVVSGLRLVAEAIARRLQTGRGELIDDPLYGYDLTAQLNNDVDPSDIGRINAAVTNECKKDTRIKEAVTSAVLTEAGELRVTISLLTGLGPFKLVVTADKFRVGITSITPNG